MRHSLRIALLVLLLQAAHAAPLLASDGYFQQFVRYTIAVKLDTDEKTLRGTETILYRNNSPDTLTSFYLHIYPNAFRSKDSQLLKEYRRRFNYSLIDIPNKYRSSLDIEDIRIDGRAVPLNIDDTIAETTLPEPLLPGDSIFVELSFRENIGRQIGRSGYRGEHYDIAQWYPKVVVYDEQGFHPDKFGMGEFYGEFGTFDVHIDVPANYVVAATGALVGGDPGWRSGGARPDAGETRGQDSKEYKTVSFHAERVHDFAWSADPTFVVQDSTWNNIEVRSIYRRRNSAAWKDSTLAHAIRALAYLSDAVGPYPYQQLTIVDALLSGGMEYPMLVMDGEADEGLVVHETAHMYFYGALGNDEAAEAWLDEGFAVFMAAHYLQDRYGPWGSKAKWGLYRRMTPQYTMAEAARRQTFELQRLHYAERVATRADDFVNSYDANVYTKASLVLDALRYVVGKDVFAKILNEYYSRYRFQHVNEERFRQVCEDVSGYDLGWFFSEWLHTTKSCDYKLDRIVKTKHAADGGYTADATIRRLGEIVMPLKLTFRFKDGATETFSLNGRLRTIEKSFELDRKPVAASLNPDNEIMDMNLSDNFDPKRRSLQFDWPNNRYYPEDAYQIRYRPGFWYNDIDGFKAGLHLSGSHQHWTKMFNLGLYYGFESDRLDFSTALIKRVRFFGSNGTATLSGYKMEGRQDGTFEVRLRRRPRLLFPPSHDITIGLRYHELRNKRFLVNDETYQTGSNVSWLFGYGVDPQLDILQTKASIGLTIGRKWMGGVYRYEKIAGTLEIGTRERLVPLQARLRFFFGVIGGQMPYQEKFHLAGDGPLAEERLFWMRSPGGVPEDLHYHVPGQGNLRGYLAGDFGVNRLLSMNFEVDAPFSLPLMRSASKSLLGKVDLTAFVDIGKALDDVNPIESSQRIQDIYNDGLMDHSLMDTGVGLRMKKTFSFYDLFLRFDVPFYVNHPEINGETDRFDYRYVFSLMTVF
jgi:hypothetical protein